MVTSTHPDPAAVLTWFEDAIDGRALLVNIKELRRNPDWRVQSILGDTLWDIDLIHWPSGSKYKIRLEPVPGTNDALWRLVA